MAEPAPARDASSAERSSDPTPQAGRRASLSSLGDDLFDVLVIGGGIVGAGVARDAAMRGWRVALVEQRDFASGTSSRSSRLLHGGIRYLAQGRVGLVREASREKAVLGRIARHLVEPMPFLFPTRKRSPWSKWKLGIGVKLYDMLCGFQNFGSSVVLDVDEILALLPGLNRERLTGAVRYYDAQTNDARLVIDTLHSAARHGATLCNYVRFQSARDDASGWACEVEDVETGGKFAARARLVINATGVWTEQLPRSTISLRPTKGVHLVVDRERFSVPEAVVIAEGSRILFAIPWGERVILGTTDTDYDGPLEEPPCESQDVDYVLQSVNEEFPDAALAVDDVLSTWSGLRPLVADPNGNPSDISRRHEIKQSERGWWDVAGGKLTTYRLIAEETLNAAGRDLGGNVPACRTADEPLFADAAEALCGVLPPEPSAEIVRRVCSTEWSRRLEDVMVRRTSWRHARRDHLELAAKVAGWMADSLRWEAQKTASEMEAYRARYAAS